MAVEKPIVTTIRMSSAFSEKMKSVFWKTASKHRLSYNARLISMLDESVSRKPVVDVALRARHVRLVNILQRIVADIDRLEEDEFYGDYDQAVDAAKVLLEEEEGEMSGPWPAD